VLSDAKQFVGEMSAKKVAVHRWHSHDGIAICRCIISFPLLPVVLLNRGKRSDLAVVGVASASGALRDHPTYALSSLTLSVSTSDAAG
jgi:hypothetical protein